MPVPDESWERRAMHAMKAYLPPLARLLMSGLFCLGRLPPAARPERDGKVFCERPHTNSRCRGLDFYPYPSSRWIGRPSGFKIRWAAAALVVFCLGTGFGVHLVAGDSTT